eukprot:CAMPEP_0172172440 /NCGR_PEP_ID=MMETSP1050-20130122/12447_1 /TAXON_ID=233186 /ORGANISM="Cryptomonas curvata, Strain CCAP979/52" /LENGTH=92 /DNA_ID=CAMNT_0012843979 /DNA_START=371 /DNA_END=645 /DNA_ORIENTATION=-
MTITSKNVVDQMNDALVQNMDLLHEQAMHIHDVNLSIHKCIQTDFVGGMPQTHFKMLREERTKQRAQVSEVQVVKSSTSITAAAAAAAEDAR